MSGSLQRQEEQCRAAIRKAGGKVVAVVGNAKAQSGKLNVRRPDLMLAVALAKQHQAIVVVWDVTRFVRPESFHYKTNPYAELSASDFIRLRRIVGPDTLLAVIVPVEQTMWELRSAATKRGMAQVKLEGTRPGPKRKIRDEIGQMMLRDWAAGATFDNLVEKYGYARSTIVDMIKELDPWGLYKRPPGPRKGKRRA